MVAKSRCVVAECPTQTLPRNEWGTLFCFPHNDILRKQWFDNLRLDHLSLSTFSKRQLSNKGFRVCHRHFADGQFQTMEKLKLNFGTVPPSILETSASKAPSETLIKRQRNEEGMPFTSGALSETLVKCPRLLEEFVVVPQSQGDTIKSQNLRDTSSKHLRAIKTFARLAGKLIERNKTSLCVKQIPFMRPYVGFASTQSYLQSEEISNTSQRHQKKFSTSLQDRKRTVHKVINFDDNRQLEYDDTDLIFLGYSKALKKMSKLRQATVKFQIAKIIMEAELEQTMESSSTTYSEL